MSRPYVSRGYGSTNNTQDLPYHRNLVVRSGYYDHQFRYDVSIEYRPLPVEVPWINVKGYWLNEAGFTIATPLLVEVSKGKIVITAISS